MAYMKMMRNKSVPTFKSDGKEITKATTNFRIPLAKIRRIRSTLGLILFSVSAKIRTNPKTEIRT